MRAAAILSACLLAGLQTLSASAQAATVQVTVLARDGQPLPDAVVSLTPPAGSILPPSPPLQHTISQQSMKFVPAVSVVPQGATVRFSNLDEWNHHVRVSPAGLQGSPGQGHDFMLSGRVRGEPAASHEIRVSGAGPMVLGCHIHGSMRGHLFVASTPWAAKTGPDGVVTLSGVPEGTSRLSVWHPDLLVEPAAIPIDVRPVTAVSVPTQIQPRRARRVAHETAPVY